MTNKELKEKIARLETELEEMKKMAMAMKKRVDGGVFEPQDGQKYWYVSGSGEVYTDQWSNCPINHDHHSIGNCYPTKQSAEDAIRVLKLTQKARETQNGFVPDWENGEQTKRTLHFDGEGIRVRIYTLWNTASIFGYWEERSMCEQLVDENREELLWYFTDYRR